MRKKLCPFCRTKFNASRFIHDHVYCCETDDCRRESHRMSSKKYRDKIKMNDEFKAEEKARVYRWRSGNPGYWHNKTKEKQKNIETENALRDMAFPQNDTLKDALRDLAFHYDVKFKGLLSIFCNPLRDSIEDLENEVYNRGQELLNGSNPGRFYINLTENKHEKSINSS